jgi:ABC-type transport system involved in cytochrome c biogenesis permease subunit
MNFKRISLFVAFFVSLSAALVVAEGVDYSAWESLPVFADGRVMPLDSLARRTVKKIVGRESVELSPPESIAVKPSLLFPDGKPRKFSAAELTFSWLIAPELWREVPFLVGSNERLRTDVLRLPLINEEGGRLSRVSPTQFELCEPAGRRLEELARSQRLSRAEGRAFTISLEDEALAGLNESYSLFRDFTYNPQSDLSMNRSFLQQLMAVLSVWRRQMQPALEPWKKVESQKPMQEMIVEAESSLEELTAYLRQDRFDFGPIVKEVDRLCRSTTALADYFKTVKEKTQKADDSDRDRWASAQAMVNRLAASANELATKSVRLRATLYDSKRPIPVVPALGFSELADSRDSSGDAVAWIGLRMILLGSKSTLADYPSDSLQAVRMSWADLRVAYLDIKAADRADRVTELLDEFARSVAILARQVEPLREKALIGDERSELDLEYLAKTAYPTSAVMKDELVYNRVDPFRWSWVLTLAALAFFVLAFGKARLVCFIIGAVLLGAGQIATCWGLWLRMMISWMVPVTNMYETVLFTGAVVGLMSLWFGLLPLFKNGMSAAWAATAIPGTAEMPRLTDAQAALLGSRQWSAARIFLLTIRAVCLVGLIALLVFGSLSPKGSSIFASLFPLTSTGSFKSLSGVAVLWVVGGAIGVWTIWFFPRIIPMMLWADFLVLRDWRRHGLAGPVAKMLDSKAYLVAGAAVAGACYLVAYFTPGAIFNREVGTGMAAVLRNNFWLALHVLTITASYGAGALAWGLGNLSLGYYAFGQYRTMKIASDASGDRIIRRPPAACATLSGYIYKAIQVAVLLLAVGTITGAIWADYAWGRYWNWDPKEVWALITLLVYLAVLHGRWAGWAGSFGLAVGAVAGATSILIAWYGVNFVLSAGLHSYGFGAGGQWPVLLCVAINWLWVAVAAVRFLFESKEIQETDSP